MAAPVVQSFEYALQVGNQVGAVFEPDGKAKQPRTTLSVLFELCAFEVVGGTDQVVGSSGDEEYGDGPAKPRSG